MCTYVKDTDAIKNNFVARKLKTYLVTYSSLVKNHRQEARSQSRDRKRELKKAK